MFKFTFMFMIYVYVYVYDFQERTHIFTSTYQIKVIKNKWELINYRRKLKKIVLKQIKTNITLSNIILEMTIATCAYLIFRFHLFLYFFKKINLSEV